MPGALASSQGNYVSQDRALKGVQHKISGAKALRQRANFLTKVAMRHDSDWSKKQRPLPTLGAIVDGTRTESARASSTTRRTPKAVCRAQGHVGDRGHEQLRAYGNELKAAAKRPAPPGPSGVGGPVGVAGSGTGSSRKPFDLQDHQERLVAFRQVVCTSGRFGVCLRVRALRPLPRRRASTGGGAAWRHGL